MDPTEPSSQADRPAQGRRLLISGLEAATQTMRETTKWIIAAYAGVALVLVAGIQLSDLGKVHGIRIFVALGAIALGMGAVAWTIYKASHVLTSNYTTLREIVNQWLQAQQEAARRATLRDSRHSPLPAWIYKPLFRQLALDWEFLSRGTANDPQDLYRRILRAYRERKASQGVETTTTNNAAASTTFVDRVGELEEVAQIVVAYANHYAVRRAFTAFRRYAVIAGGLVALCVALFAWIVSPSDPINPRIANPMPVTVHLSSEGQRTMSPILGKNCVIGGFKAVAVGGPLNEPEVVVIRTAWCNAERFTVTRRLGIAVPDIK